MTRGWKCALVAGAMAALIPGSAATAGPPPPEPMPKTAGGPGSSCVPHGAADAAAYRGNPNAHSPIECEATE